MHSNDLFCPPALFPLLKTGLLTVCECIIFYLCLLHCPPARPICTVPMPATVCTVHYSFLSAPVQNLNPFSFSSFLPVRFFRLLFCSYPDTVQKCLVCTNVHTVYRYFFTLCTLRTSVVDSDLNQHGPALTLVG
jgi:hypothetical protein